MIEDAPLQMDTGLAAIPMGVAGKLHVTFPLQVTETSDAPPPVVKINSPL